MMHTQIYNQLINRKHVICSRFDSNIVATFQGMHVLPAKHSYAWLPRKCDYRTDTHRRADRQTGAAQSDPYVPLCFGGDTKMWLPANCNYHTNRLMDLKTDRQIDRRQSDLCSCEAMVCASEIVHLAELRDQECLPSSIQIGPMRLS